MYESGLDRLTMAPFQSGAVISTLANRTSLEVDYTLRGKAKLMNRQRKTLPGEPFSRLQVAGCSRLNSQPFISLTTIVDLAAEYTRWVPGLGFNRSQKSSVSY